MKYSYIYRKRGDFLDIYTNKIKPLFDSTGLSNSELEKAIGLPRSTIYNWNKGVNKSYKKYICEIANYFHLSLDYFSESEQKDSPSDESKRLSEIESKIITIYRNLPEEKKKAFMTIVESLKSPPKDK